MQDAVDVAIPACPYNMPGDKVRDKDTFRPGVIREVLPCADSRRGVCDQQRPQCMLVIGDRHDASAPPYTRQAHKVHNDSEKGRKSWQLTPERPKVGRPRSPRKAKLTILVNAELLDWANNEHAAGRLGDFAQFFGDIVERVLRYLRTEREAADATEIETEAPPQ